MTDKSIFKEFRPEDGFPYCPQCEEDELASTVCIAHNKVGPAPTLEECFTNGFFFCYQCNWTNDPLRKAMKTK